MYITSGGFKMELDIKEMKVLLQALDFVIALSNPQTQPEEIEVAMMVDMAEDIADELDICWEDPRELEDEFDKDEADYEDDDGDDGAEFDFEIETDLTPDELRNMGDALYAAAGRLED